MSVEVDCVGVVSESSSGGFAVVVVVVVLEDFGLVLWSSWRMLLWHSNDFLRRFIMILVAGNIFVAVGGCLFGIVIKCGFLNILDFLEFLEELGVLVWWR